MTDLPKRQATTDPEGDEMKRTLVAAAVAALIFTTTAQAHRLSGHPRTLAGKIALAKAQFHHDHAAGSQHWLRLDRRYLRQLRQHRVLSGRPPHFDGWVCIHNREATWHDGGAPYYGGLQMSWNWMGAVPGGDASRLSPLIQMWIAERVSARHGFSYSWMHGQWPNTYPPCARFF